MYKLEANNGPNTLHGGAVLWSKQVWAGSAAPNGREVVFTRTSPDGESGCDQAGQGRANRCTWNTTRVYVNQRPTRRQGIQNTKPQQSHAIALPNAASQAPWLPVLCTPFLRPALV